MPNYHLHIEGQVQGVGFRPHVFRLAESMGIQGWVNNGTDGVHIEISGSESGGKAFIKKLLDNPPPLAKITRYSIQESGAKRLYDFQVRESDSSPSPNLLITPDLGLCDKCRAEIHMKHNRRYGYAFTTCVNCGPRYSIIKELPYDRKNTAMDSFTMCLPCHEEYHNPDNRRYYSQTNSCDDCGIILSVFDSWHKAIDLSSDKAPEWCSRVLKKGSIIALKGIGGYLLLADATNPDVIVELRKRKNRPTKPFALLYPSLYSVSLDVMLNAAEMKELTSIESPIVLLRKRKDMASKVACNLIAPGLNRLGIMLPYTPLLELIMKHHLQPIIATSGNISGSPIFFQDKQAFENLSSIADYFIVNDREILIPQDDSVVQFATEKEKIVLRRSRGLAPTYLPNPFMLVRESILSTGADLKSTFSILTNGNLYISQYVGDLENYETQASYRLTLDHLLSLLKTKPSIVLTDKHPDYFSTQLGRQLAKEYEVQLKSIQHHEAHFSAVLAENNLMHEEQPVLGVVWDGTGWGNDGNIWGGEFLTYANGKFDRIEHLKYFEHLLGDKFSKESRLSAFSLFGKFEKAETLLKPKFSESEWRFYNKLIRQNNLKTSSMGRLFDGVASMLGLCDTSSYEGEAAIYLEACATQFAETVGHERLEKLADITLPFVIQTLASKILSGTDKDELAYSFHVALVNWIDEVAMRNGASRIAFSGGVFQNALLVNLINKKLGESYKLYFHKQLSPNDECVSFGQLAHYYIESLRLASQAEKAHLKYQPH